MKLLVKQDSITGASIGRLLQFLSDSCFAVIGSRDKDADELRTDELYQLVTQFNDLHHNGYNKCYGRYEYTEGPFKGMVEDEPGIIIYNIPLEDALGIAKEINQESVVYKDKNKSGIYYTDGSVDMEFDNHPKGRQSHFIFTAYAGRPNSWKHGKIINADTANLGVSYTEVFKIFR